jgi:hypothetical protein
LLPEKRAHKLENLPRELEVLREAMQHFAGHSEFLKQEDKIICELMKRKWGETVDKKPAESDPATNKAVEETYKWVFFSFSL